jgi:hypothetical protein
MIKHALNRVSRDLRILGRDVVGYCIQIAQRRFGPDYFSHGPMRALASACATIRPSAAFLLQGGFPNRRGYLLIQHQLGFGTRNGEVAEELDPAPFFARLGLDPGRCRIPACPAKPLSFRPSA